MMKATLALIVLLVVITLLVRLVESRFAFFPLAGETVTPNQFGIPHETLTIATDDGEQLRGWAIDAHGPADHLRPDSAVPASSRSRRSASREGGQGYGGQEAGHDVPVGPRARIVYFHGNGGNLSIWAPILAGIARQGYAVIAFDYRGYGNSTGRPTERGLYRDVDAVLERFWSGSPPKIPVVYWGRSLGATMAAYAATIRPPDGLILESAFPDVRTLARRSPPMAVLSLFSTYRFPTADFLQRGKTPGVPVLVMHGNEDRIVPIGQGRALFEKIPGPKRFFTIRGGDHNDMAPRDAHAYWEAVDGFLAGL